MDKTLNLKLEEFKKSIDTLSKALDEEKSDIVRDSVIKRFEYTFELCWKTAKVLLDKKFGVNVFSPKEAFRKLLSNGLISEEDVTVLLEMTDDRNEIIHTYNQDFSNELYSKIQEKYFGLVDYICNIIDKTLK